MFHQKHHQKRIQFCNYNLNFAFLKIFTIVKIQVSDHDLTWMDIPGSCIQPCLSWSSSKEAMKARRGKTRPAASRKRTIMYWSLVPFTSTIHSVRLSIWSNFFYYGTLWKKITFPYEKKFVFWNTRGIFAIWILSIEKSYLIWHYQRKFKCQKFSYLWFPFPNGNILPFQFLQ